MQLKAWYFIILYFIHMVVSKQCKIYKKKCTNWRNTETNYYFHFHIRNRSLYNILVWCNDCLCNDDFHNITLNAFALT